MPPDETDHAEQYADILEQYYLTGSHRELLAAAYLGRDMLEGGVSHEELVDCCERGTQLLAARLPDISTEGLAQTISGPCLEMCMAFASVARQENARSNRDGDADTESQELHAHRLESLGVLAGGIAHDFNNMLSAIIGYCDLMTYRHGADFKHKREIGEIRKAGQRAAELTRQLLAFGRKQVLKPTVLRLDDVVRDVDSMLRRLIREDIDFVLDLEPDTGCVRADPSQLAQVITNLVVNASDAMPAGGTLSIRTFRINDASDCPTEPAGISLPAACLSVRDSGLGMDDATVRRAFEPFYTTKEVGQGTGLGLATVHGIIKQSQGHVAIESELNQGTTFFVYLPQIDESPRPASTSYHTRRRTICDETILVVEDEPILRDYLKQLLGGTGYSVMIAEHGGEALELARGATRPIDLLLTDLIMPRMSGLELAVELQASQPDLRVLYMSGYVDTDVIPEGALSPDDPFIAKPFSYVDMLSKIREELDA